MAKPARSPTAEALPAAEKSRSAVGSGLRSLASAASGFLDRWSVVGTGVSRLEKTLGDQFPEGEHYFGLDNFGNTCYCNSVLQVTQPPPLRRFDRPVVLAACSVPIWWYSYSILIRSLLSKQLGWC